MTNRPEDSNRFATSGWKEFNFNLRPQGQIRHGKHAHPDFAEINAKGTHARRSGEYMNGGIQQLPPSATSVCEVAFEHHMQDRGEVKGSATTLRHEDYGGSLAPLRTLSWRAADCGDTCRGLMGEG